MRYLLLIFFFGTSFLNAQKLDDTRYLEGVDYVTCICMKVVLNKQIDCKSEKIAESDIPKKEQKTLALFKELQSLKSEKNRGINFLSEKIFNDKVKYEKIFAFADKRKVQILESIKPDIENYLMLVQGNEIRGDLPESTNYTEPEVEEIEIEPIQDITTIKPKETVMQQSFLEENALSLITGILLIILLFYVIYLSIHFKKKFAATNSRIDRRVSINDSTFGNVVSSVNSNPVSSNSDNKIQELSRKIVELENAFKILNEKSFERHAFTAMPIEKQESTSENFYMSVPNEDGTFDVNGRTSKEAALYEFIVDSQNQSLAKFTFTAMDTKIIQSVVDYSQSYINPVCDPQNALNQNAKRIITLRPGTAEKRNDKWIVLTKAQIKYE